jgi:signal transduction histidine kinase
MLDTRARRPSRFDVLAALGLAAFLCITTGVGFRDEGLDTYALPLCAAAGLAFVWRRVHPRLTLALAVAAMVAYAATEQPGGPIFLASFLGAANLALFTPARVWLRWTAATAVAISVPQLFTGDATLHLLPVVALLFAVPKLASDATRARRLREQAREQETARRVAEERLRIAREVHDVVGHGLATIALRAGVAGHVRATDPDEVDAALAAIRDTAKQSLGELGALLGVLRAEEGVGDERAPVPDLSAVPQLVERLRDAGMRVELDVEQPPRPVPDVVGAAGYRIVQEALTNVARHAGAGASARVRLEQTNGTIEVEITDDGRGAPAGARDGGGLAGMRERATALGGRFEAGTAPGGGGFRVWASLPAVPR